MSAIARLRQLFLKSIDVGSWLEGVTPGTATASKAVVLDSSKGVSTITSATITTLTAATITATALPTSDPTSAGALYNASGTVKISSG